MQDEYGAAGRRRPVPSKPVVILGWSSVPSSGDEFREVEDEREARHIASEREAKVRAAELVVSRPPTLNDLLRQAERAEIPELNLIVKADVQGSLGALSDALLKLPQDEVRVNIVRSAAGGITKDDISLAMASDAVVIGFNVRPDKLARELAEQERRRHPPVPGDLRRDRRHQGRALGHAEARGAREAGLGEAEVRQTVPGAQARRDRRLLRPHRHDQARTRRPGSCATAWWSTTAGSGRSAGSRTTSPRSREGYECGIGIENFQDIKEGDVIEAYEVEEVARSI